MMIPINNLKNTSLFDTIYIHEDHYSWLVKNLELYKIPDMNEKLFGVNIIACKNIPKWRKQWIFPYTPFVEYEKSDEVWARSVGFGHEEDSDEPAIFAINEIYSPFKPLNGNLLWNY